MISSMLRKADTVTSETSSKPAVIVTLEEKKEHDPLKTRLIEASKYHLSNRSSSSATDVSVREVLDDPAIATKDHQTRKSISTSSTRFPEENVCETYKMLKTEGEKVARGDSLISVMGKRNDGSYMREEINDSPQKKSTSLGYVLSSTTKASGRMNETQFSRFVNPKLKNVVDGIHETRKKRVDSNKSEGNLSDILRNHTLELHLQRGIRARSTELISRGIVPRENTFLIGERTFLTEPTTKRKPFRARRDKK